MLDQDIDDFVDDYADVVGWQLDLPSRLVELPPELLTDIWLFTFVSRGGERTFHTHNATMNIWHGLKNMMAVCRRWREVALHASMIWRSIEFSCDVPLGVVEIMMRRCKEIPVDMLVKFEYDAISLDLGLQARKWRAISSAVSRARSFEAIGYKR